MSVAENKAIIRRCVEDYTGSNQRILDQVFTSGYIHHSQVGPIDLDGFKRGLTMHYQAFPDGQVDVH